MTLAFRWRTARLILDIGIAIGAGVPDFADFVGEEEGGGFRFISDIEFIVHSLCEN